MSFGLVSIPVRLHVATESHAASLRQLCRDHPAPIPRKRWCDVVDHEVPFAVVQDSDVVAASEPSIGVETSWMR